MIVTSNIGLVLMCGVDNIRAGTTNRHPATCCRLMRDKTGDTAWAVSCDHTLMQCTHFVTQCAAVRTHCVPISAPPQRYWFSELISATCQHHSAGSPSSPPTTRPSLSRPRAVPLTPHTYLLYTGGRAVVVLPCGGPGVKTHATVPQTATALVSLMHSIHWKSNTATNYLLQ